MYPHGVVRPSNNVFSGRKPVLSPTMVGGRSAFRAAVEPIFVIFISSPHELKMVQPRIHNRPIDVYYWFHAALWVGMSDRGVAERRYPPWLSRVVPIFYAVLVSEKKIRW